jgi:hypothetical protein
MVEVTFNQVPGELPFTHQEWLHSYRYQVNNII